MTEQERLRAADLRAREAALDIGRSFIVQAPAGSGKTELLIQRYLRLLAVVDEPEEILAITFTRKAAAEMRLRVLEALDAVRNGVDADSAHRQVTADAAAAVLGRDAQRGWGLVENPGRMRVMTLDALNASIARMQPLTAGSGAQATIVEDSEVLSAYREAAVATLDWLTADDDNARVVGEVLAHVDGHTGIYIEQLARLLATRDQWLPFVGSGRLSGTEADVLRAALERQLGDIIRRALTAANRCTPALLATHLPPLAAYAARNLAAAGGGAALLADEAGWPGTSAAELPRWLAIGELLLTGDGAPRRRLTVLEGFPAVDEGQKEAMLRLLGTVGESPEFVAALGSLRELPPARYPDEQWNLLLCLFRLLPVGIYELRRLFATRGITDHVEVAQSAAAALGTADEPGSVALLLDYAVRHVLVDEMQDTSRAQYRLLEALTAGWEAGDGRTLFCVGDPMQSIYRFRNAEVMQFLRARESGIGGVHLEPLLLRQNFRSGERLVDWFNATFASVLPAEDDPAAGAVAYAAATAIPGLAGQGQCVVHPGFGSGVEREAEEGADLVAGLVAEHPGESIAVLVRSRTQLPNLLRQLRARRVACQSVDIDRLTDLPEILDLLALTRALVHPGDRVAWLGLLRSPWIALDWTDLHTLVAGAANRTVLELLAEAPRVARLSAAGQAAVARAWPVLADALAAGRAETLERRVERAWWALGGPALLADADAVDNVYRFLDTLARLETGGSLPDVAELYAELDAERVSSGTAAAVQVMTMHKAKGLQFDHVVLYATGRRSANSRGAIMSWVDLGHADLRLVGPMARRDEDAHDPVHRFIERTSARKEAHELARLLYVACTRARRSLHIAGQVALKDGDTAYAEPPAGTLLRLLWPAVQGDFAEAFRRRPAGGAGRAATVFVAPPYRRLCEPWQPPEFVPLARAVPDETDAAEELRVEYEWVGFEARLAGTVVHRWLQAFASDAGELPRDLPAHFEVVCGRWLAELGAATPVHAAIVARARAAVENVLADERGRWLLRGKGAVELALTGLYAGRIRSVVIDRVRVDDDGTHWIVDYKTGTHEGGDLDGFLRAETDRYRGQLARYATVYRNYARAPVRCGLYFPLLARFVEVATDG